MFYASTLMEVLIALCFCLHLGSCLPRPPLDNPFLLTNGACQTNTGQKLDPFGFKKHLPQVSQASGHNGCVAILYFVVAMVAMDFATLAIKRLIVATSFSLLLQCKFVLLKPSSLSFLDLDFLL